MPDLDSSEGLLRGAIAIAAHERPSIDEDEVSGRIDQLAEAVRDRVSSDDPRGLLAHTHALLFDEEGFRGAEPECYDEPANSFVDAVLESRRGLPITLALVYTQVLTRLGIQARGLDTPGHFLAQVRLVEPIEQSMIVDVFTNGRLLGVEEARTVIGRLLGARPSRDRLLRRATHSGWLGRMLRNLMGSYTRRGRTKDRRAMEELYQLLDDHDRERRASRDEAGDGGLA